MTNANRKWTKIMTLDVARIALCGALAGSCISGLILTLVGYTGPNADGWRLAGATALFCAGLAVGRQHVADKSFSPTRGSMPE